MLAEKIHVYTVTEITRRLRELIESNFPELWIEGEVSNIRMPHSGHLYFTLKDGMSQIQAVCFNYRGRFFGFELKDGMKVLTKGMLTVYERGGNYQINVQRIEPVGIGSLQLAIEALKKKLFEEGLFKEEYKKPIPIVPRKIGLVTSPTGAAIRDIFQTLDRRFPRTHVILAPCLVQGDLAPVQIEEAIVLLNQFAEVDVIVITRGGGSLEDLMAFNDERVARAIFRSTIPVVSAIGHEIDWTIADYVADLRAPTPTAAAELIITKESQIKQIFAQLEKDLHVQFYSYMQRVRDRLRLLETHYVFTQPLKRIQDTQQLLDQFQQRFVLSMRQCLGLKEKTFVNLGQRLNSLSPLACLARGYSITKDPRNQKILRDVKKMKKGQKVQTLLAEGTFISVVEKIN